ncbi:MAG: hypothetical protein ACSHYF_09730 [Verrucomicrobiaceae bacterium]
MSSPIKQEFPNGCGLACLAWSLGKLGGNISQGKICEMATPQFPKWTQSDSSGVDTRGVMTRLEFLRLTMRLLKNPRNYIHTQSHQAMLSFYHATSPQYLAGFVLHRKPTNHFLSIEGFRDEGCQVMCPSQCKSYFINYGDLEGNHDADFMLFSGPFIKPNGEQGVDVQQATPVTSL